MRHLKKIYMAIAAAALLAGGCASRYDALMASSDADLKYKGAFEYFNSGKYEKAGALFESLAVLTSNTSRDDTVQFYQGLSNYKFGDYPNFLDLDCLYKETYRYELDQTPTYTCINAISEFLRSFPDSEYGSDCRAMLKDLNDRLDRKAYENARLYYKMEDYKAARVAFKNVLKDDSENIYREDILYYIAMSSYNYARLSYPEKQKDRYLIFIDDYLNFIGEIPDSPYRKELNVMYARAQRALGKYSGTDEQVKAKEKDFEKERRAAAKAEQKKEKSE